MPYKIGIDVGGTFTDFLVVDAHGESRIYKTATTPSQPERGLFNGLEKIATDLGSPLHEFVADIDTIVHGTTITTNAVLTGNGAKTAFLTTKGFRDILNMRRGLKERQFDFKYSPPPPIVPRHLIFPIEERSNADGESVTPLNEADVERAIVAIKSQNIDAVAVSYLWSFLNPVHEQQTAALIAAALPDLYCSLSSEILPQIRVYERHSTTVLNAYAGPPLARYLTELEARFKETDFPGVLLIMQSNGGVLSPQLARRFAANTLLSGPAGGPMAGVAYGRTHSLHNLITVDMGGTSFDASVIHEGRPSTTTEGEVGGHRLGLPMLDIHTVGAGGGSIAAIDSGGMLQVGPLSAGAEPGPVCYNQGGEEPTVTDADLLLGFIDPDFFLGGEIRLDVGLAEKAMEKNIARALDLSVTEAAEGVYRLVNANMAAALRVVSVEKGHDPREFTLVVAGGAGPLHAGMIARELDIPLILIPRQSSVFCAAGMLISDLRHDYVRTFTRDWKNIVLNDMNAILAAMRREGVENLEAERIPAERMRIEAGIDIRYVGQFNEVEVGAPEILSSDDLARLAQRFHEVHDGLYGYSMPGAELEVINIRLSAIGETEKPRMNTFEPDHSDPVLASKGERKTFFAGSWRDTPVYDSDRLGNGHRIAGPALVESPNSTILVPPDYTLVCDAFRNYLMHESSQSLDDLLKP
jgi:N-methylhydantoinase A